MVTQRALFLLEWIQVIDDRYQREHLVGALERVRPGNCLLVSRHVSLGVPALYPDEAVCASRATPIARQQPAPPDTA